MRTSLTSVDLTTAEVGLRTMLADGKAVYLESTIAVGTNHALSPEFLGEVAGVGVLTNPTNSSSTNGDLNQPVVLVAGAAGTCADTSLQYANVRVVGLNTGAEAFELPADGSVRALWSYPAGQSVPNQPAVAPLGFVAKGGLVGGRLAFVAFPFPLFNGLGNFQQEVLKVFCDIGLGTP